jgi:ABC-2 type transport system ATP-binding protein
VQASIPPLFKGNKQFLFGGHKSSRKLRTNNWWLSLSNSDGFVSLKGLTKNYGPFRALDNVSFNIKEGEVFGYIGPNGAGKTTTMKILVGLTTNFQGQVEIGGYQIPKQRNEAHKLLGYLPQAVAFQDWRTINHTLKTFGKLSGLSDAQLEERIPKILQSLGLADVRFKKVSKLSGGMAQKVGLAQALLHEPKFLVLDEPLGGLDPLSRNQFKEIVRGLAKNGTTVLFSSHILSDVQDVADRVGIISRGKIKQVGTINELRTNLAPQTIIEVQLAYVSDRWQQFKAAEGVKEVALPSPGQVRVTLEPKVDADNVVDALIKIIAREGIRVRGIAELSPSLDEIYFRYVTEGESN